MVEAVPARITKGQALGLGVGGAVEKRDSLGAGYQGQTVRSCVWIAYYIGKRTDSGGAIGP